MTFEVEIDAVFSFLTVLAHRRPLENALQSHTSPMSMFTIMNRTHWSADPSLARLRTWTFSLLEAPRWDPPGPRERARRALDRKWEWALFKGSGWGSSREMNCVRFYGCKVDKMWLRLRDGLAVRDALNPPNLYLILGYSTRIASRSGDYIFHLDFTW